MTDPTAALRTAVLAMLDMPFTLTVESAERDAERLGIARENVRRLALASQADDPSGPDVTDDDLLTLARAVTYADEQGGDGDVAEAIAELRAAIRAER